MAQQELGKPKPKPSPLFTKDPFIFEASACPVIPLYIPFVSVVLCNFFPLWIGCPFTILLLFRGGGGGQGQQAYLKCSPKAVQRFLLSFSSGWWVTETVCEDLVRRNLRVFCGAVCSTPNPRRVPSPRHRVREPENLMEIVLGFYFLPQAFWSTLRIFLSG